MERNYFEKLKCVWENNIEMNIKVRCEHVDFHLCDGAYGPMLGCGEYTVKLCVLQKVGYFLSNGAIVSQGFFSDA
jgi:hypothetical protein